MPIEKSEYHKGGCDVYRNSEYHQGGCDIYRKSLNTTREAVISIGSV